MSKLYLRNEQEHTGEVSMAEAFPFLCSKNHVVSLVGGGGKTTLMYLLAEYCRAQGYRTLVTTTTHIQRPKEEHWVHNVNEMEQNWNCGKIAVIGEPDGPQKIKSADEDLLKAGIERADMVFIEADGAKCMPCKVPNATEPVILPESDIVVGIMGLEVIGEPMGNVCFRSEEAMKLLQISKEHRLTEEDVVKILTSPQGTKKNVNARAYYVVLNKCDSEQRYRVGSSLLGRLQEQGIEHAVMTRL